MEEEEEEEGDWNALLLLLLPPLRDPFQTNRKPTLDRRRNGADLFFFSLLHALPLSTPGNYHGSAASRAVRFTTLARIPPIYDVPLEKRNEKREGGREGKGLEGTKVDSFTATTRQR